MSATPISDALRQFRASLEATGLCEHGAPLAVRLNSARMGAAFVNELSPVLDRRTANAAYLAHRAQFYGMDITWPSISEQHPNT